MMLRGNEHRPRATIRTSAIHITRDAMDVGRKDLPVVFRLNDSYPPVRSKSAVCPEQSLSGRAPPGCRPYTCARALDGETIRRLSPSSRSSIPRATPISWVKYSIGRSKRCPSRRSIWY